MKITVPDREIIALLANSGAVQARNRGATEFDILDDGILAGNDPDCLALRILTSRIDVGASPADTANGQTVGSPGANIAGIGNAGIDFNRAPGSSGGDSSAWRSKRFTRSNLQSGLCGRQAQGRDQYQYEHKCNCQKNCRLLH